MKKNLLLFFLLPLCALAQNGKRLELKINGKVTGLQEKSLVYLTDGNKPTDTLMKGVVKEGSFVLAGVLPETSIYEINFGSAQKKFPLFIGNEQITIKGNIENLKGLEVTGSTSQNDFSEFQKTFNPLIMQLNALQQSSSSMEFASKKDSLMQQFEAINTRIQKEEDQFIGSKKSSFVSPFVMLVLSQLSDNTQLERRFNMLDAEPKQGFFGKYIQDQIEGSKIGEIGSEAIDFTQSDTAGKPVRLSSFKGKYVLVDFWASWCRPCRMENPNVVATYNKFKGKNFTVLGVSLDKAKGPWVQAIKDDNLTWTHVSDLKFWNNDVAVKYHIQQIPQNLLIGPDGKIVAKNLRGPDLESKLCELLGCN
ncbi:MAG: AhpC/TSA family protein [Bacteroidetes bacterium]|nr:AhpC/TSA family protein [Bacteroidota bacterium]